MKTIFCNFINQMQKYVSDLIIDFFLNNIDWLNQYYIYNSNFHKAK